MGGGGEPAGYNAQSKKKRINGTSTELFLELELSRRVQRVYTFASISYPIYHIYIYVYIFSISFLSNAVPPINPKILSFIILCHRGGGWMENIERDPTINSIRSQSKNDPIGFQWQFGKSFKFLFERYFNEVNEIVFPTIQREVSLKKIDRVINPDRASSLRSRFRIPKNDIPQSCSPKLISQVFEEIFRETRVSRESSYVNSTRSRISSRASPTRKRQSSQRSKFHRYKFMGLNINEAEG